MPGYNDGWGFIISGRDFVLVGKKNLPKLLLWSTASPFSSLQAERRIVSYHTDVIEVLYPCSFGRKEDFVIASSPETKSDFDNKASLFYYIKEWCLNPAVSGLL